MTRAVFTEIDNELDVIDEYLVKLARKFGSFDWNGKEYVLIEREELDTDYDGNRIWTGKAFDMDGIFIEEAVEDAEKLSDIDITIGVVQYTKDALGEVKEVEDDYWFEWSVADTCFVEKWGGHIRKVVA